jgi:hypothetical protein
VTVSPERLQRWLDGFGTRHGPVTRTFDDRVVRLEGADGAVAEVEVPFPPLDGGLVEHVLRDRRIGVLLVRLGGCACGVFDGPELVASKVTTRQVHGRIAAGGQSQQRFARRRDGQVRVMHQASADTAVRVLLPRPARWTRRRRRRAHGGGRGAGRPPAGAAAPAGHGRLLDGPDPRMKVLEASYDQLRAVGSASSTRIARRQLACGGSSLPCSSSGRPPPWSCAPRRRRGPAAVDGVEDERVRAPR